MAKGLLIVELDLNDNNLEELRENQGKLKRSLEDGIWGALSWYGDRTARVEDMSITLGSVPMALSKVTASELKELSVRDQTGWLCYILESVDDKSGEAFDLLERVHGALESRLYMGIGW